MLIIITEFGGTRIHERALIEGQFGTEEKKKLKIENQFKHNQFSTPEEGIAFFKKAAEKCIEEICDSLEELEFEDLKVLILVQEIATLHHIVCTLQDANIKCFVYSHSFSRFVELPNYFN
jgi:phosphoserine phosphatase